MPAARKPVTAEKVIAFAGICKLKSNMLWTSIYDTDASSPHRRYGTLPSRKQLYTALPSDAKKIRASNRPGRPVSTARFM